MAVTSGGITGIDLPGWFKTITWKKAERQMECVFWGEISNLEPQM